MSFTRKFKKRFWNLLAWVAALVALVVIAAVVGGFVWVIIQ